ERWDILIELDPADETAHVALMRRYAANGDRHSALRQYERLDRHLRTELGVTPGREATALREQLLGDRTPVRRSPAGLVGRDREVAVLARLVGDVAAGASCTVFVHGPAGIGKSALLQHVVEL